MVGEGVSVRTGVAVSVGAGEMPEQEAKISPQIVRMMIQLCFAKTVIFIGLFSRADYLIPLGSHRDQPNRDPGQAGQLLEVRLRG